MKGALLTAAVLLGSAQAATHKLKLKKIPLAEQLVCAPCRKLCRWNLLILLSQESVPIDVQVQHLGQKYMGVRPQSHTDAVFNGMKVDAKGNHPVPISNFMNAQCRDFHLLACRVQLDADRS